MEIDPTQLLVLFLGLAVLVTALCDKEAMSRSGSPKVIALGLSSIACGVALFKIRQLLSMEDETLSVMDLLFIRQPTWGSSLIVIGYAFLMFYLLAPLIRWWRGGR